MTKTLVGTSHSKWMYAQRCSDGAKNTTRHLSQNIFQVQADGRK